MTVRKQSQPLCDKCYFDWIEQWIEFGGDSSIIIFTFYQCLANSKFQTGASDQTFATVLNIFILRSGKNHKIVHFGYLITVPKFHEISQLSITNSFITKSFHVFSTKMQSIIYEQFDGVVKVNVDVLLNNYFLSLSDLIDYNVRYFYLSTNFYLDRFSCFFCLFRQVFLLCNFNVCEC